MLRITACLVIVLAIGFSQYLLPDREGQNDVRLAPKLMNYQGFITDTLNNPITDSLDILFRIYDAASAGNLIWSETQLEVPIIKGIFHVLLGTVTAIPDSVFTKGTDRWLELRISSQNLVPRTRITAAPYAYTADYADTATYARNAANDNDWTRTTGKVYTYNLTDSVGIRTATPRYALDVNGIICGGTNDTVLAAYGAVLGGYSNLAGDAAADTGAVVAGGIDNAAIGKWSVVGGGRADTAGYLGATVAGGVHNVANLNMYATVGGGVGNVANGYASTVGGGFYNRASFGASTIAGGQENYTGYEVATVGGGAADTARAWYSGVFSGYSNLAGGTSYDSAAVVAGGYDNSALGKYAFIGGGRDNRSDSAGTYINSTYSVIGGGQSNTVYRNHGVVAGGYANCARGASAAVAGGTSNTAGGQWSVISGGYVNRANGTWSTVAGGDHNSASGIYAAVGGGGTNAATTDAATIGGGRQNTASGQYSFIGGGYSNSNSGDYSTIPGGYQDTITETADFSYLFGIRSKLTQDSTFMVDLPHIRFGTEAAGYEFPPSRGSNGQALITNGSGQVSWGTALDNDWTRSAGKLYTYNLTDSVGIRTTTPRYALDVNGVICGGTNDTVLAAYGAVLGGYSNKAGNAAADTGAVVAGGYNNTAVNSYSFVGGGYSNDAYGIASVAAGGYNNSAGNNNTDTACVIGGGWYNIADGSYATVAGGRKNLAQGNRATVCGGDSNRVEGFNYSTICGGLRNRVDETYGFIGGGLNNQAIGTLVTIGGGEGNIGGNAGSTVGGGRFNENYGYRGTIAGGYSNEIDSTANYASIGGGYMNTNRGYAGTIPGGYLNVVARGWPDSSAAYSFAAGYRAKSYNSGCFTWGDNTNSDINNWVQNRWIARCSGGVYFYTNASLTSGVFVASGGGSWSSVSDRNLKENFQDVDGAEVLEKLATMPITTWNYKSQDPSIRHIGPMAQDFAAFGVGEDDNHITTIDADGIALVAIQELYRQNQELKKEIEALKHELKKR